MEIWNRVKKTHKKSWNLVEWSNTPNIWKISPFKIQTTSTSGKITDRTTPMWPLPLTRKSIRWQTSSAWVNRKRNKGRTACREKPRCKSNNNARVSWLTSNLISRILLLPLSPTTKGPVQRTFPSRSRTVWLTTAAFLYKGITRIKICLCEISPSKWCRWRILKIWSLKWTLTTKNSWMSLSTENTIWPRLKMLLNKGSIRTKSSCLASTWYLIRNWSKIKKPLTFHARWRI